MQSGTIKQMIKDMGFEFDKMEIGKPIPIQNWEIQTINSNGDFEWKKILHIIRKENAKHILLETQDFKLSCSPEHKVYVKNKTTGLETYEEAAVLIKSFEQFEVRTLYGWQNFTVTLLDNEIEIADMEVEGTHSYLSNGILSHNTMYGDPNTTPGGMAIPYHASVRIKLTGGQQIKQTINGKEVIIGINVSAKTIKNKVARPWREVDFEIHFGKGIFENEQIFDTLREYCDKASSPVIFNGNRISVEGSGAWKTFTVANNKTGEILVEEKFYKSEFGERILNNPKHQTNIKALMDAVYIMNPTDENHTTYSGIDTSSAVEVEAAEVENKKILLD